MQTNTMRGIKMKQITITITTDGQAFADDYKNEIQSVLTTVTHKLRNDRDGDILDSNGNKIGTITIEKEL